VVFAQDPSSTPASGGQERPSSNRYASDTPAGKLRDIILGHRVAMMVGVVAELGVADVLKGGPKSVEELAAATKSHPMSLYRVLRALASFGIFAEDEDGRFRLTPTAELLRSDAPGSQRESARALTGERQWRSAGNMLNAVRSGKTATEHAYGMSLWEYLAKHPEEERAFNERMAETTRRESSGIVKSYDFSRAAKVIDIAGGQGVLLSDILKAHSQLKAVLFELPSVIEAARQRLDPALLARVELKSGDFFKSVPEGGDIYILKNILHDWEDERAVLILKTIRQAMSKTAKVLVIEGVVPKGNSPSPTKMMDITMLVATGGRERTEKEHRALLHAGGFRLTRVIAVSASTSILEAVPE
jgi:hypothetical protein